MAELFPDRVTEGLFTLLRIGLGSDETMIPLAEGEWKGLLGSAARQSVIGIVYAGVSRLPEDFPVPDEVTLHLMAEASRIRKRSALVAGVLAKVKERFNDPIVLKGPAVAVFYPEPELRESGDLDLYFPDHIAAPTAPDGSSHLNIDGIDIDIHRAYFDLGLKPAVEIPSPEATLLMLSAHILKHAFSSGTGLRQICDIALAYRSLDYDEAALKALWKECGMVKWNNLLSTFIRKYFGIQAPLTAEGEDTGKLLSIVLEGGNFGHFAASRREALSSSPSGRKADTLRRILQKAPFGLKYAPGKYLGYLFSLAKGNL